MYSREWMPKRPTVEPNAPILVAVYGTLRQGGGLHPYFLSDARHVGKGKISGAQVYCLGGCPGVILRPHMPDAKVVVEVYEIDRMTLYRLDGLEGFYDRVLIDYRLDSGRGGKAFLYTITDDDLFSGMDLIPHGDWVKWDSENGYERYMRMRRAVVPRIVVRDEAGNLVEVDPVKDDDEFEKYHG